MSDIKLFRVSHAAATELPSQATQVEKSLQTLFEANLDALLGVRFLASEYSTGPVHGGRIDTLGLDEDGTPVIIEYKRATNENVINQGLFYLDWLLDHRKEFQWLVMERLGAEEAASVEWASPRLICIAGDFTRYDGHAVKQINRSIELLRYRRFEGDLLLIELVHAPAAATRITTVSSGSPASTPKAGGKDPYLSQRIDHRLQNASPELLDIWTAVVSFILALGDDVRQKEVKLYHAFKRLKNFVCLEIYPSSKTVVASVKLDPAAVPLEPGFTRDMRGVGQFGTGDLQVTMSSLDDVLKAQPLFQRAYDGN